QWDSTIIPDNSAFGFKPRQGLGVAVDLGTTTIVAQLLDLQTGYVLGVATALNEQAKLGADIMTRIEFALTRAGREKLKQLVRNQIERMIHELLAHAAVHQARTAEFSLESII